MGAGARGINLLKWIITFTVICSIMLLLRLWAARIQKRKAYADDWMVLVAFANTVALGGVAIWAIYNGIGKHTNELTLVEIGIMQKVRAPMLPSSNVETDQSLASQLIVAANVCWLLGTVFNKLSVLWLYRRIFKTPVFLRWSMGLFLVVVAFGVAFFVVFMTQCRPVSYIWNPVPGGSCRDLSYQEYASVSVNMAIDLAIFILPLPVLWSLQMTTRNKFYVTVMLSFGLITIGVMAWRIEATYDSTHDPDFVYSLATIGLISLLELWLGIIVACMPTIPPILQTYVRPAFEKLSSYYYSRRGGSRDRRKSSNNTSGDFEMHGSRRQSARRGPSFGAPGLSTKVTSQGRDHPPLGTPVSPGRALRGMRDDNPYVSIDDERPLWTSEDRGAWQGSPQAQSNFIPGQDEGPVTRGIHVRHELNQQEEDRPGRAL